MPSDNPDTATGTGTEVLKYCSDHGRPCDQCPQCKTLSYCPECDRCYSDDCVGK